MCIIVKEDNFEAEVLGASHPVVLVFYADWCEASGMILPFLEGLSITASSWLGVGKVNVETQPELTRAWDVRAAPTIMLFDKGRRLATKVGAIGETKFFAFLEAHLEEKV